VTLKLVMIRCPDNVALERREVSGGEFSIGRGPDNQWVVADPDRHLSKRHCRFVYAIGDWELHDLSTNGTFVNDLGDPIGKGASQKMRHGDRVKFGPYELEVIIDEADDAGDPFPAARHHSGVDMPEASSVLDAPHSSILPPDFDPLAPNSEPFAGPTEPDHVPVLQSAFRPPRATAVIPDDWDVDVPVVTPRKPPEPPPPPAPMESMEPLAEKPRSKPRAGERPPAVEPQAADATGAAEAFLRGTGLSDVKLVDAEKTLERIGAAVRQTVAGLRQTLMARASIKDEFRIEQTMIRPTGNNPLKFSLDDDDALATLLGVGRRGGMAPEEAIAEAFDDLRMHELATISAMQAAVRVLLAQFEPEALEHKVGSGGFEIHPAQKKARAWDAFVSQHRSITQALSDDFDSAFGKAFARAYEEAIEKLNADRGTT
jgi:type VI secretion system protein ImpI/type VI secretion system protein